jgi:hypothetical protein
VNRLNFRFTGRYAIECNDPLSGLLWSTISDNSTISLRWSGCRRSATWRACPSRFFDPRMLRSRLTLPMSCRRRRQRRAALRRHRPPPGSRCRPTIAARPSRSATVLPPRGNAIVIAVGPGRPCRAWSLPRMEGPTLAVVPNPTDPFGLLLVIGGRNGPRRWPPRGAGVGREALSGELATIQVQPIPPRVSPMTRRAGSAPTARSASARSWSPSELQAFGYVPGPIAVPFRTAPDLYTARERAMSSLECASARRRGRSWTSRSRASMSRSTTSTCAPSRCARPT